jgi:hypothetical protein
MPGRLFPLCVMLRIGRASGAICRSLPLTNLYPDGSPAGLSLVTGLAVKKQATQFHETNRSCSVNFIQDVGKRLLNALFGLRVTTKLMCLSRLSAFRFPALKYESLGTGGHQLREQFKGLVWSCYLVALLPSFIHHRSCL